MSHNHTQHTVHHLWWHNNYVCCGVWVCGVVVVWSCRRVVLWCVYSKTPPCVDSKRLRVYIQNVPVCTSTTSTCLKTCGRGASTHGNVLNVHMGVRSRGGGWKKREQKKKFSRAPEVECFERFDRQHRLEPPPGSLLTLPFSSLLHHLPCANMCATTALKITVYVAKDENI